MSQPEFASFDDVADAYTAAWEASTDLVFASPQWLRAVGTDNFGIVTTASDSEPAAFMPVSVSGRRVLPTVTNPPLTPWLYPVCASPGANLPARIASANRVGAAIAARLPAGATLKLRLHPSYPSLLGFHWSDLLMLARVSYRIDATSVDEAFANLRGELRTDVRKARKNGVHIETSVDDDAAAGFFDEHARATGFNYPFDRAALAGFLSRAVAGDVGRVWAAFVDDRLAGAALVAHDSSTSYFVLAASNEAGRKAKAMSLLAWSVVEDALAGGSSFDFAGSMLEPVERFNRAFGARQVIDAQLVRPPYGRSAVRTGRAAARLLSRPH